MNETSSILLLAAVATPLVGTATLGLARRLDRAQALATGFAGLALALTTAAWACQAWGDGAADARLSDASAAVAGAGARGPLGSAWRALSGAFALDRLNAPLAPLAALLFCATIGATPHAKAARFSFGWTLVSLTLALATLTSAHPWGVVVSLALGVIPPWRELLARGRSTRVFAPHMALFVALLALGWTLVDRFGSASLAGAGLLTAAVLVRMGCAPLHCWMTDLFENATFGGALLFVTPMAGAYAAARLVLPVAPLWALQTIALASLVTAVYAAGMALVQREARRFFCYLFLSQSSLVLVGLELATPIGLTGSYCLWLSVGLALAGFGLTLRALEARAGRVSLEKFNGLYDHAPSLAAFFLLTGLASIGFPGTIGFIGAELLVEGAVRVYPYVGLAVVAASALQGIAVLRAYFQLFGGARKATTAPLQTRWSERVAVLAFSVLILAGGFYPQPGVVSRYQAAQESLERREARVPTPRGGDHHAPAEAHARLAK